MSDQGCTVEDCERSHYAHGWCRRHYDRWRQSGDPVGVDRRLSFDPFSEELWEFIDRSGGPDACWPWTLSVNSGGYGGITRADGTYSAHRLAYALANGPIPEGIYVLHRCDNRPCCNPAHLFLGSHADNMDDMVAKGRGRTGSGPCEQAHNRKLTQAQVDEIRTRYPGETQRALAREFGVHPSQVSRIVNRRRWQA